MSISELDNKWFDFTSQFVDKLNKHKENWDELSESEQELAALWKLEMDVHNGGFLQFFTNWGIVCYEHAIRCLKKIEAEKSYEIITSAYEVIDKYKDDERLITYQSLYDIILDEELDIIDELDEAYWGLPENIQELTFKKYGELEMKK